MAFDNFFTHFYFVCKNTCLNVHVCGASWGWKRAPDFPEPELQMVLSCHVSAGTQTQTLLKNSKFSEPWSHLSSPSLWPLKNSLLFFASPPAPHASTNSFLSCMSHVGPHPFDPSFLSSGLLSSLIGSSSTSQLWIYIQHYLYTNIKGQALCMRENVWSHSDLVASLNIVCSSSPAFSENFIISFFLIAE